MIQNAEQFEQTLHAMGTMYRALGDLRAELWPQYPNKYALFAQGPLDEIQRMQADIDRYLQVELILQDGPVPEPVTIQE
jgi:hypothetical protein